MLVRVYEHQHFCVCIGLRIGIHFTKLEMRRANLTTPKAYSHICGRSDDKHGKTFSTNVTSVRIVGVFRALRKKLQFCIFIEISYKIFPGY